MHVDQIAMENVHTLGPFLYSCLAENIAKQIWAGNQPEAIYIMSQFGW